jgi:lysophospholipase L1-like esterase
MGISAAACAACLAGLGWTLRDYIMGAPAAEPVLAAPVSIGPAGDAAAAPAASPAGNEQKEAGSVHVVALGDSLAKGTGDSAGKGFAGYAADLLQEKAGQEVELQNYGVDGLTAPQLSSMLSQQDRVKTSVSQADILLVSIGGNDLFRGGETLMNLDEKQVAQLQKTFNGQLDQIVKNLRQLNSTAPVYVMGLYNPFPYLNNAETANKLVRAWNSQEAETISAYGKTIFVPTFDLFQQNIQGLLHTDMFHPNAKGYRLMAERLAGLLAEGQVGAP